MVSVASLLNPFPMEVDGDHRLPSPCTDRHSSVDYYASPAATPSSSLARRPKMCKDAPIFTKGKVKGEVRYPPHEESGDDILRREIRRLTIYPFGRITEFPRHIPYNSDKKDFQEKTGRESFEVFQYTFTLPGEEQSYTVIWDYNVGLVRVTPFFKCCKYSKTTPAKMLNSNPGLRDICHSITGGALAAQGYWMPYEAARHLAATFCYSIRYALVPLFGPDFVSFCHRPDNPSYGRMIIRPDVIRQCTIEAQELRRQGEVSREKPRHASLEGKEKPRPASLDTTFLCAANNKASWTPKRMKSAREKQEVCSEWEYDTDTESDACPLFPDASSEAAWKRSKQQRSRSLRNRMGPRKLVEIQMPPTPTTMTTTDGTPREKRCLSEGDDDDDNDDDENNHDSEDDAPSDDVSERGAPQIKRRKSAWSTGEARAAYMLMQLYVADAALGGEPEKEDMKR